MAFRKHVMISFVLLAITGLLLGCSDDGTTTAPNVQAEAPILAPYNVNATILTNGDVSITWDANAQAHLRGYNVYRLDYENSRIGKLNPDVLSVNNYIDRTAVPGNSYQYHVTCVSVKNNESSPAIVNFTYETQHSGKGQHREQQP